MLMDAENLVLERPTTALPDFPDSQYRVSVWFERDRKNITLESPTGEEIACLWDDEVDEAIEDGFLERPRHPRPSAADWKPKVLAYARSKSLIA